MKVGFIGLGSMGTPMARNLIKAGHSLTVYNRTRHRAEELELLLPRWLRVWATWTGPESRASLTRRLAFSKLLMAFESPRRIKRICIAEAAVRLDGVVAGAVCIAATRSQLGKHPLTIADIPLS